MKQLIALYIAIGVFFSPFIYSNNAYSYKPESTAKKIGYSLGNSFYWPSYLFSIEPEVDSESIDSFQKSIIDMIKWRGDKLYTGGRSNLNGEMVFLSISNCLAVEGLKDNNIASLYSKVFTENLESNQEIEKMRDDVMSKMDGYDFSDIIEAGAECNEELSKL